MRAVKADGCEQIRSKGGHRQYKHSTKVGQKQAIAAGAIGIQACQGDQMARVFKLPLVLEPQPEGGYTVMSPLPPELLTEGETISDVTTNISDALAAVLELYDDLGRSLPMELTPLSAAEPPRCTSLVTIS